MAHTSTETSVKPKEDAEEKKSSPSHSEAAKPIQHTKQQEQSAVAKKEPDDDDLEEMRQITEKAASESNKVSVIKSGLSIFIPDLSDLSDQDSEKEQTPKGAQSSNT